MTEARMVKFVPLVLTVTHSHPLNPHSDLVADYVFGMVTISIGKIA
jgi:hypothetical protein